MLSTLQNWVRYLLAAVVLSTVSLSVYAAQTVELAVNDFSEMVHISVDEYPAVALKPTDKGKTLDISHMFGAGNNTLRVQAFNGGGSTVAIDLDVLVDGTLTHAIDCSSSQAPCGSDSQADSSQYNANGTIEKDAYYDETFYIYLSSAPQKSSLSVQHSGLTTGETAAIYINDRYTGYTVSDNHTFSLPPGDYTVAVGASTKNLVSAPGFEKVNGSAQSTTINYYSYTGRYFEKEITLAGTTTMDLANESQLPVQDAIKLRIVPIQTTNVYTQDDGNPEQYVGTYQLDTQYISRFSNMLEETSDKYFKPLTYELNELNISTHSLVSGTSVKELNTSINSTQFLEDAGLVHLRDEYDVLVFLYANSGTNVAWTGGKFTSIPQSFIANDVTLEDPQGEPILSTSTNEREVPNELVLHETLHIYENLLSRWHNDWRGINGLHGAENHGYQYEKNTYPDRLSEWMQWYEVFIRSQAVEPNSYHPGYKPNSPASSCGSLCRYVGVFKVTRQGFSLEEGNYSIRNLWRSDQYINHQAGITVDPANDSALQWEIERVPTQDPDSRFFWLRNADNPNEFFYATSSDNLIMQTFNANDQRGQWLLGGFGNQVRIKNRATGQFLNMEFADQTLSLSTYASEPNLYGWWSGRWVFKQSAPQQNFEQTLQAEDHQRSSGTVDSNHAGYTGTGFVNTDNAIGESVTFDFNAPVAGNYVVEVRYANGSSARDVSVAVNSNTVHSNVAFDGTGAWTNWDTQQFTLNLSAGTQSVNLEALNSGGLANIDSYKITLQ